MPIHTPWGFAEGISLEPISFLGQCWLLTKQNNTKRNNNKNVGDSWRFLFITWDVNIKKKCRWHFFVDGWWDLFSTLCVLVFYGCQNKSTAVEWLKQQTYFLSFGGWKSKIKVLAWLVSPGSSLAYRWPFSRHVLMWPFLSACSSLRSLTCLI